MMPTFTYNAEDKHPGVTYGGTEEHVVDEGSCCASPME
jgi:hypothetical protein